jgi:L-arabinokinase
MSGSIAYYVTDHGYGHGVRSSDVLNALHRAAPEVALQVVTGLPEAFLRNRVGAPFRWREARFDSGMFQLDSVRVDLDRSLAAAHAITERRRDLVAAETAWLREHGVGAVVCDVPAIPLEAARALGLPALALSNFSWSWIYGEFADRPGWAEVIRAFEEGYQAADAVLSLPFSEPFSSFAQRIPVPLLAHPGRADRARLAAQTGADPAKSWVLLSFTTLEWDEAALLEVRAAREFEFFTLRPLAWDGPNLHPVRRESFAVPDLFATVDAVLTKPGYGVLSECLVNRKPMVWVDRDHFRETPLLVAAIRRHLAQAEIPSADLYAGRLVPALHAALAATPAEPPPPAGGDAVCAAEILRRLRGRG